jgi:hypothetical protein
MRISAGGAGATDAAVHGQPYDFEELVEVEGEHEDSGSLGGSFEEELAAARALDPYQLRSPQAR